MNSNNLTNTLYKKPKFIELPVYKNGQFLVDIPSFVEQLLQDGKYGIIKLKTMIRRPSKGFEKGLERLQEEYLLKHPVEDGIYPLIKYNRISLEGKLHFEPTDREDGLILEEAVKRIDELRKFHRDYNKHTTIMLRIETYSK